MPDSARAESGAPSGLASLHHSRLSTRSSYQLYSFSGDRRFCDDNHGSFVYDSPNLFCGPSGSVRTGLRGVRSEPGHRTHLTSLFSSFLEGKEVIFDISTFAVSRAISNLWDGPSSYMVVGESSIQRGMMKRNEATNTQSGTFSRECVSRLKNSTLFSQWVFCPGFYVNSFSGSCPKTISRARKVSPTGSTTLLRLQLCLTIDCTHRSRHSVFYFLERKLPAQVSWKTTLQPLALRTRFDYLKRALRSRENAHG